MASLTVATASLALWDPLDADERVHVRRIVRHSAEAARADFEAEMLAVLRSQALLAQSWATRATLLKHEWDGDARVFLGHHPACAAVGWDDPASGVRWSLSARHRSLTDVLWPGTTPWTAAEERALAISPAFRLTDGRLGVRMVARVARPQGQDALMTAVFDLQEALGAMLADHLELGYALEVRQAGTVAYRTPATNAEDEATWSEAAEPRLPGGPWRLTVWPMPDLLSDMRSSLPELALLLGCLLGSLLALSLLLARRAALRSRDSENARAEVERRVEERTMALRAANDRLNAEVAERRQAEAALRQLSSRLLRLQDEERRRLARDLHDSTAQLLGAATLAIERARRSGHGAGLEEGLEDVSGLLGQATQEVRTLSFLLHPPMLDDLGLEYVLPWYAEGFSRRSGVAVSVDVPCRLGRLPEEIELALYRIVQEALANVRHHSGSGSATVTLFRDPTSVTLEIADRGHGMPCDLEWDGSSAAGLGVGIAGMRERVTQLGGQFEMSSAREGTTIRVVVPICLDRARGQGHEPSAIAV